MDAFIRAHNDNARAYTLQKITEMVDLLAWYRQELARVDPGMSDRDRRVLMFAVVRCADVYRAGIQHPSGILLGLSQHFRPRS